MAAGSGNNVKEQPRRKFSRADIGDVLSFSPPPSPPVLEYAVSSASAHDFEGSIKMSEPTHVRAVVPIGRMIWINHQASSEHRDFDMTLVADNGLPASSIGAKSNVISVLDVLHPLHDGDIDDILSAADALRTKPSKQH
jgi:hypothetical protein